MCAKRTGPRNKWTSREARLTGNFCVQPKLVILGATRCWRAASLRLLLLAGLHTKVRVKQVEVTQVVRGSGLEW
jgi:hypothetical protein